MRQKLNQIHKNFNKKMKEDYFRQRRVQLLRFHQQQRIHNYQNYDDQQGWRGIILDYENNMQQQQYQQYEQKNSNEIDFEIKLNCIEDGQYYLNVILEQGSIRCFEATIYLLDKLINKLMEYGDNNGYLQCQDHKKIVYMILTHILNILQTNNNKKYMKLIQKNKKYLKNLFVFYFKKLIALNDAIIINQLFNISQIICNQYKICPNYELIKYLLFRVSNHQSLKDLSENTQQFISKIQNILLKYIILCKIQEKSHLKQTNIPYSQIAEDYNTYIKFKLINVYSFIKNNKYPFHYDFVNDSLSYILTLQTQIVKKFRVYAIVESRIEEDPLIKCPIITLLEKIALSMQQNKIQNNSQNEVLLMFQQYATVILWYLIDSKLHIIKRNLINTELQRDCYAIFDENRSILGLILLIKVKLRELISIYQQ